MHRHQMRGKRDFTRDYSQTTPMQYFETFEALNYCAPDVAAPVVLRVAQRRRLLERQPEIAIADLGCSYGVNAMVWRTGKSFAELANHFARGERRTLSTCEQIEQDRMYFEQNAVRPWVNVVGQDVERAPLLYGTDTGLLSGSVLCNLERCAVTDGDADLLRPCALIVATGVVGYISETTILAVAQTCSRRWILLFVARTLEVAPMIRALNRQGFATSCLSELPVRQRRFCDTDEQASAIAAVTRVHASGDDVCEEDGWVYAFPVVAAQTEDDLASLEDDVRHALRGRSA
jgi:hypothetical protein